MTKSTLNDRRPAGVICRERGWGPNTCLVGNEGYGPTVIRITAVGEARILARAVMQDGVAVSRSEGLWNLSARDWQEVQS